VSDNGPAVYLIMLTATWLAGGWGTVLYAEHQHRRWVERQSLADRLDARMQAAFARNGSQRYGASRPGHPWHTNGGGPSMPPMTPASKSLSFFTPVALVLLFASGIVRLVTDRSAEFAARTTALEVQVHVLEQRLDFEDGQGGAAPVDAGVPASDEVTDDAGEACLLDPSMGY